MEFSRQKYCSGLPFPSSEDLPNPEIELGSLALQADSLLAESPRKPMNTGVDRLSFLQGIFLTQKSNWGLLHCRHILYQRSYQGSPFPCVEHSKTQIGSATCSAVTEFWPAGPALLLALCRPAGPGAPARMGKGRVRELHPGGGRGSAIFQR